MDAAERWFYENQRNQFMHHQNAVAAAEVADQRAAAASQSCNRCTNGADAMCRHCHRTFCLNHASWAGIYFKCADLLEAESAAAAEAERERQRRAAQTAERLQREHDLLVDKHAVAYGDAATVAREWRQARSTLRSLGPARAVPSGAAFGWMFAGVALVALTVGSILNSGGHSRVSDAAGVPILAGCVIAVILAWSLWRRSAEKNTELRNDLTAGVKRLSSQMGCGAEGCTREPCGRLRA